MGKGIQIGHRPTQAEMTAAKYDRDFYVVFQKHADGTYMPETSMVSATLDQLVTDIIGTEIGMPSNIESIVHFNPVAGISRIVDREVADAVAERTHELRKTPHESVIDWLEQWSCDFYESDEYLNQRAQDHLEGLADYRRDLRMMAAE